MRRHLDQDWLADLLCPGGGEHDDGGEHDGGGDSLIPTCKEGRGGQDTASGIVGPFDLREN